MTAASAATSMTANRKMPNRHKEAAIAQLHDIQLPGPARRRVHARRGRHRPGPPLAPWLSVGRPRSSRSEREWLQPAADRLGRGHAGRLQHPVPPHGPSKERGTARTARLEENNNTACRATYLQHELVTSGAATYTSPPRTRSKSSRHERGRPQGSTGHAAS